jgi:hypothetical protein
MKSERSGLILEILIGVIMIPIRLMFWLLVCTLRVLFRME